jgi:hypothetical protein
MALSADELRVLDENSCETIGSELRGWVDPTADHAIATVAKACIAFGNNNGG